jgi:hypothetical protein
LVGASGQRADDTISHPVSWIKKRSSALLWKIDLDWNVAQAHIKLCGSKEY